MYKLFLTFRYLTRKAIVIFPILVVWLCVMMLIIVASIMGGFVNRVQDANRQLLGDIVIDSGWRSGFPYYEELQRELEKMPEVVATTPVVRSYGLVTLPEYQYNTFAQIIGIDPAGRARISGFRKTLFMQYAAPRQAAEDLAERLPAKGSELQDWAREQYRDAEMERFRKRPEPPPPFRYTEPWRMAVVSGTGALILLQVMVLPWWRKRRRHVVGWVLLGVTILAGGGLTYWVMVPPSAAKMEDRRADQSEQREGREFRLYRMQQLAAMRLDKGKTYRTEQELLEALVPAEPTFTPPPGASPRGTDPADAPKPGCIVGVDIGRMYPRDRRGNYLRRPDLDYAKAMLTVVPISPRGTPQAPQDRMFMIVDNSYTGVVDVDSTYVYAPFKDVQEMNLMAGGTDPETNRVYPAKCNEVLIKVKDSDDPAVLRQTLRKVEERLRQFQKQHEELAFLTSLQAQTWDQKQAQYISAVQNEKVMLTFVLGLMSVVVLVVIFLIFYQIVRDKTRDIGIIKAVGGSEEGVAGIFLFYGLFIGLVGGVMGMVTGVLFVWHTNEIHEWIYQTTGILIWNRSVYLFDRIPDTVNPAEVATYVAIAILAGGLGALIPALIAGVQNPVKAVRYE